MYKNILIYIGLLLFTLPGYGTASDEQELAKTSQNPVGNMISLPFEYYHYDGMANDSSADALIAKPVYPVSLGDLNLINRFIIPYLGIDARDAETDLSTMVIPASSGKESGFGNIQYQGFLTAAEPGKVIYGLGPVFEFPSNSSGLGSDKWSGGLAALALTMPGKWVLGALVQNMWSFAGPSDEPDVNKFTFQYFLNYNIANGWYLTSSPIFSADWEASSDEQWTVPMGGGFGKLVRFGNQPVDFKLQAFSYLETPEGGPDWSLQFAVKFLFPK